MKYIYILIFILFSFCKLQAQSATDKIDTEKNKSIEMPKLVIGIVVDQMKYDYLNRFYNKFGDGGFKRLMNQGFNCKNTHFNYVPTYTAVGHTSIYTGTTPSMHGIIGNDWYDKSIKESIYCVDDNRFYTVGADKGGQKSPFRLQVTTVTDQLKLVVKKNGKTIGISLKDRSAILPAGHNADAAYWFRGKMDAKFITSSFYMNKLPEWVENFNSSGIAKSYLKDWKPLYNIKNYTESIEDDNSYEKPFKGEIAPVFPHKFTELMQDNGNYDLLKSSPDGNSLIELFAEVAIKEEKLGQDNITDFLAISFSSTDYIGHRFGPDSKEVEDTYLRLDQDIKRLLLFLDKEIGENNYSLFLTADHAVASNPSYLESQKINAGYFKGKKFKKYVKEICEKYFNTDEIIANISNSQIFLNIDKIESLNLDYTKVANKIKNKVMLFEGVYKAVTAETLQTTHFSSGVLKSIQNGYNQKYSGDIIIMMMPGMLYKKMKGSTHGTAYNYDTHVPLLFFGKGFKHGETKKHLPITNIAPTISSLLKIDLPNACSGRIIEDVLE